MPVDTIVEGAVAKVLEVDEDVGAVLVDGPHDWKPSAGFYLNQRPVAVHQAFTRVRSNGTLQARIQAAEPLWLWLRSLVAWVRALSVAAATEGAAGKPALRPKRLQTSWGSVA